MLGVGRVALLGVMLYPVAYLLVAAPHRGWIDFYQIFSGAQALWQGDNPYSWQYHSPPWLALALGPLLHLPYDPVAGQYQAPEGWFWLSLAAFGGALGLWLPALGIRLRSLEGALLMAAALVFAPTLQTLLHGQTIILLLLALSVLGTPPGRSPLLAGFALAALTIKPQVTALVLGGVVLRLVANRSGVVVGAFVGIMAVAVAGSFLLRPTWPQDWWISLANGSLFTKGSPAPYHLMTDLGIPATLALILALSFATVLGLAYAWRAWTGRGKVPGPEFVSTGVVLGLLAAPYSHSYDFVLLLLPGLLAFTKLRDQPTLRRGLLAGALFMAYWIPLGRFLQESLAPLTLASALLVAMVLASTRSSSRRDLPSPPAITVLRKPVSR